MSNNKSWDIKDDSSLKTACRSITQYDTEKLSEPELDELVKDAKRELALKAGVTSFYDDRGIAQALNGTLASKAKGAVENSPVVTKDISGKNVTFRASDGSSLQLAQYESMTQEGLSASDRTDAGPQKIRFTNDYLNDTASR